MAGEVLEKYQGRGALDAFLNLFSLITLVWLWIAINQVLFQLVDKMMAVSPTLDYYNQVSSQVGLKLGMASIIIVAPIFLIVINVLHLQYKNDRLNHNSGIYRWLTYLMLLASALTIIYSLINLIFNFLNGGFTAALIIKILVTLILAAGVFGYYVFDLRRKDYSAKNWVSAMAMVLVIIISSLSLIGGFFTVDSPQETRLRLWDQRREYDLSSISNQIAIDYDKTKTLPANLKGAAFISYVDPVTQEPYEYQLIGPTEYQLCATFSFTAPAQDYSAGTEEWFRHKAGRECFNKKIDLTNIKTITYPVVPTAPSGVKAAPAVK
ncbi:MAG: DUF5671 domain-containing protein [Patescibacteria group bacterium]